MTRALPPLILQDRYYLPVEKEIRRLFDDLIYKPMLHVLGMTLRDLDREVKNSAAGPLHDAIARGVIWYADGQFKGRFSASTSAAILRLGGKYNLKSRTYSLPEDNLPTDLRFAQAQANARYEALRTRLLSVIDNMDPTAIDWMSKTREEYERTITHMDGDLQKTMPPAAPQKVDNPATAISRLGIEAKLTDTQKAIIAQDWGQNLDLYIKGWAQDNILQLREKIQPHVIAGGRAEGLVKVIQDNYGIGVRKAKFLARQETALLMAKFQETRYLDIGIQRYRWSTAHDVRVRHDHHALNGKVFRFDQPPVSNRKTGARNNPGQDYNCRCVAIPLVE